MSWRAVAAPMRRVPETFEVIDAVRYINSVELAIAVRIRGGIEGISWNIGTAIAGVGRRLAYAFKVVDHIDYINPIERFIAIGITRDILTC